MNLQTYLLNKGLEKVTIEAVKNIIRNDRTISELNRQHMIATIESCSTAKDIVELLQMISSPRK